MEGPNRLDALGNRVIIGNRYGFSVDGSGVTTIKIGRVIKHNIKSATLEVDEMRRALYHLTPYDCIDEAESKRVQVKYLKLFPVPNKKEK